MPTGRAGARRGGVLRRAELLRPRGRGRLEPATRRAGRRSWRGRSATASTTRTTCDELPGRQDDEACDARPLGWLALSAEICAGRPVLAAFRSRGSVRGHMIVVKGFSVHGRAGGCWSWTRGGSVRPGRDCEGELDEGFWLPYEEFSARPGRPGALGRLLRDSTAVLGRRGAASVYSATNKQEARWGPGGPGGLR